MTQKQKVISSKNIFKAKLFDVMEMKMNVPHNAIFHHVDMNPTILVLPLSEKYEVYLINQYRYMFDGYVLGAIAGHIEKNESPLRAAKRELKEEAGIEAAQWELLAKIEGSRSVVRVQTYIFLAKNLEIGQAKPEEDEDITLVKMPLSEAVDKIMKGEIYHSGSMTGILMLNELKKRKQI